MAGVVGNKLKIIKNLDEFNKKSVNEIYNMRNSFINYFRKHFKHLLLGFICSAIYFLLHVVIIVVIINGLGISITLKQGLTSGALLLFLIAFMPTPGSSGLGEGMFILIFQGSVPLYLIGIVIILWRFFYQYLTAIIGVFFSAKFFSQLLITKKTTMNSQK